MRIAQVNDNNRFLELCTLVVKMYKEVSAANDEFNAINSLMEMVYKQDFCCFAIFDDNDNIVGITLGHYFSKNKFYFSGIYVIIRNNEWTKKLIDFSFDSIRKKGYTSWLVDTTNPNISSIMEKYSAVQIYTRYEGIL